jgi:large subunit ribosomal protein L28
MINSNVCYHCGKGVLFGRSHTHHRGVAGGRWKKRAPKTQRIFEPNLQAVQIMLNGVEKRVKLCTKCLKRVKKDMVDGKKPFVTLAHYTIPQKETSPVATA